MYIPNYDAYFLTACAGSESSQAWSFYTEVQTTTNGDEERISLRELPEETLMYNYVYFRNEVPEVNRDLFQNLRNKWLVPYWFFGSQIYSVAPSLTRARINIENSRFIKVGDVILLYGDRDNIFFTDVLAVGADYVEVDFEFLNKDLDNFRLYPTTFGYISEDFTFDANYNFYTFRVTYNISKLPEISELPPIRLFNGYDVFDECVSFDGDSIGISNIRDSKISGNTLGVKVYGSEWGYTFRMLSLYRVVQGADEYYELLRWFMRRLGQYRPFYMPTYMKDFDIINISTTEVTVKYGTEQNLVFAAFKNGSRDFTLHKATISEVNGDVITYTFDIELDEIPEWLCYAMLYRLSSDSIDFDFSMGDGFVVTSIPIRSVV